MKNKFKFIEKKNFWLLISLMIIIPGLLTMSLRFFESKPILNYGIDFVGGNTFNLKLSDQDANDPIKTTETIRNVLKSFKLDKSQIQTTDNNEVFIKTIAIEKNITSKILKKLKSELNTFEILEIDFIGPSIGKSLRTQSLLIILFITIALLVYITFRFELYYGIAAICALVHDALVIISISSLFQLEQHY